jgi:ABC-type transport system substrate-binding protein
MRTRRLLAGVLIAALAAGACGGDDDDESSDGDTSEPAATATAPGSSPEDTAAGSTPGSGTAGTTAPDERPTDPNGVLRVASFQSMFWDPATLTADTLPFLQMVYDTLITSAPDGTLLPGLAESWEYSEDGLTLTLHLQPDVTFQDGAPFDAEAVKANLERSMTLEASVVKALLTNIAEITVVDPLTVELHLTAPDATLPASLAGAAGAMASPAAFDDPAFDQNPVGAGPFTLAEFVPGAGFTLERWDGYWNPDAIHLKTMEVRVLPDTAARINAIRAGELDIAPIEPGDVEELSQLPGLEVLAPPTLRYVFLAMNTSLPPLENQLAREAISMAIDRQSLVDGLFYGLGEPTVQPWPEGYVGHVDGLEEEHPYDPEGAKELLAEAGLADGFEARIVAVPQPVVYGQLAEAVQAQLAELGITLSVKITEATELGSFFTDKTAEFALLYTSGSNDPASTIGAWWSKDGFFNAGKLSTPRLEELYQAAISTTDEEDRAAIFTDVTRELVDNTLVIPLFFARAPVVLSERVVGYVPSITNRPDYRSVGVAAS